MEILWIRSLAGVGLLADHKTSRSLPCKIGLSISLRYSVLYSVLGGSALSFTISAEKKLKAADILRILRINAVDFELP